MTAATKPEVDLGGYYDWLVQDGYQLTTVELSVKHVRTVYNRCSATPTPLVAKHQVPTVRRYLRYVDETGDNPLGRAFVKAMRFQDIHPARRTQKGGSRIKNELTDNEWRSLRARLRNGDDTSKLLVAYMVSPLRVGAFLWLTVSQVNEDTVCSKVSRDWLKGFFAKPRGKRLYQILCKTERCAYARLLKRLADESDTDLDTLYKTFHALRA